jgi:hypothetical protein
MAFRYRNKSTIQSIIDEGLEKKMLIKELSLKEVITNSAGEMFVVNIYNLYEKYYELLLEHTSTVVLSDEEYLKYKYQPRRLAQDLYNNQDFYYMLLRLNYIYSVSQFDFKELRVFKPGIVSLLNEILVKESEEYIDNEMAVLKKINE